MLFETCFLEKRYFEHGFCRAEIRRLPRRPPPVGREPDKENPGPLPLPGKTRAFQRTDAQITVKIHTFYWTDAQITVKIRAFYWTDAQIAVKIHAFYRTDAQSDVKMHTN